MIQKIQKILGLLNKAQDIFKIARIAESTLKHIQDEFNKEFVSVK
jgi:hypothetical protein